MAAVEGEARPASVKEVTEGTATGERLGSGDAGPVDCGSVAPSCAAFVESQSHVVTIDSDAVTTWATSVTASSELLEAIQSSCNALPAPLPLRFDSHAADINFHALLHLLRFGAAYEVHDKLMGGRTAHETVLFGLLAAHISGKALDAAWMSNATPSNVAEYFNMQVTKDVQVMPAVYQSMNNELYPFAEKLAKVLNATGAILKSLRYATLGDYVLALARTSSSEEEKDGSADRAEEATDGSAGSAAEASGDSSGSAEEAKDGSASTAATDRAEGASSEARPSAVALASTLATSIPAFRDVYTSSEGAPVTLLTKAQRLMVDLHYRFREALPACFNFRDIAAMCICADPNGVAVLRSLGILKLRDDGLRTSIESGADLTHGARTVALRAAAVAAVHDMQAAMGGEDVATVLQLSVYLSARGEDTDSEALARHRVPASTAF